MNIYNISGDGDVFWQFGKVFVDTLFKTLYVVVIINSDKVTYLLILC